MQVFPDGFHAAICQCASYAIHQATENMDVYKDKPIYLLVCANKNWGVGTLTITGTKQEEREENVCGDLQVGNLCIHYEVSVIYHFSRDFIFFI